MKKWLRLVLLVVTIGGGFAAGSQALTLLFHPQAIDVPHMLLAVIALVISVFVMTGGLIIAIDPTDMHLLIPAIAIQLPYFSSSFLTYKFGAALPCFLSWVPQKMQGAWGYMEALKLS